MPGHNLGKIVGAQKPAVCNWFCQWC